MYFITGLQEEGQQFTGRRCFGFYPRKHQAITAIADNAEELHEDTYSHLVIEKCAPGVYPAAEDVSWFRFDRFSTRWVNCARPQSAKDYYHFSLG